MDLILKSSTSILIAHRLSTILHADSIAVLDHGQLIATGTHTSLLESCALYSRLASLQFREADHSSRELSDPVDELDPCVPD